jgi:hypothetical protein
MASIRSSIGGFYSLRLIGPLEEASGYNAPMPLYWSRNAIPELAKVPKTERGRIWWEALKRCGWTWRLLIGPVAGMAVMVFTAFYYKELAASAGLGSVGRAVIFFTGWGIGLVVMEHFMSLAALPHIRHLIGGLCLHCGYDLRSTPGRCPECGRTVGREN